MQLTSPLAVKFLGDNADLAHNLARFDAAKAQCRYDRDRQKLLAVIEASFGTTAPFNQLVVEVLNKQVLGLSSNSRRSPATKVRRKDAETKMTDDVLAA